MSQFNTTYQDKKVTVDYSTGTDLESLDGIIIKYESGEQIDYDNISTDDWWKLYTEVRAEAESNRIDSVMGWD